MLASLSSRNWDRKRRFARVLLFSKIANNKYYGLICSGPCSKTSWEPCGTPSPSIAPIRSSPTTSPRSKDNFWIVNAFPFVYTHKYIFINYINYFTLSINVGSAPSPHTSIWTIWTCSYPIRPPKWMWSTSESELLAERKFRLSNKFESLASPFSIQQASIINSHDKGLRMIR